VPPPTEDDWVLPHAAQVTAPAAICAPHPEQNAITNLPICLSERAEKVPKKCDLSKDNL
jgi:hypothetical protein